MLGSEGSAEGLCELWWSPRPLQGGPLQMHSWGPGGELPAAFVQAQKGAERPSTGQLLVRSTSLPTEALRGLGRPLSKEPLSRIGGNRVVLSPEPRTGLS